MYIWALFLKKERSVKDKIFSSFMALIINANLCCSRISTFLALIFFASYEK